VAPAGPPRTRSGGADDAPEAAVSPDR